MLTIKAYADFPGLRLYPDWRNEMRKHKSRVIASGIFAALVLSLSGLSAQATIWAGTWDPQFGAPFVDPPDGDFDYDLGWGGKVKVNDGTCAVPIGGGTINNDADCNNEAVVVANSLFVTLYEYPDTTAVGATLAFDASSLQIVDLRYDSNGKLTGFSTGSPSNWVADSGAGTGAQFSIGFVLDSNPCNGCDGFPNFGPLPSSPVYSGPVLFAGIEPPVINILNTFAINNFNSICEPGVFCEGTSGENAFFRSNVADYPADIKFTPEPGSLALIAIGMLAAGSGLRRRLAVRGRRPA